MIVKDTVSQDDDSVLISNMRTAIKSSNVNLDMTIIPGVVLIPSRMIILERPVPGYNNVLTTATKKVQFGKNQGINFEEVKKEEKFEHTLTITPKAESNSNTKAESSKRKK